MLTDLLKLTSENTVADHERIRNNSARHFTDSDFPVGSVSHQGDVILLRLEAVPAGAKPRANRQVADGDTQGSRHVLVGGEIYDADANIGIDAKYRGPVFRGGCLTHPEHGHQSFEGDMIIAVVYQRNLDAEQREARVLD